MWAQLLMVLVLARSLLIIWRQKNHVLLTSDQHRKKSVWLLVRQKWYKPRITNARFIRTLHYYRQFALSFGKESPYVLSKFNFYFWQIFLTIICICNHFWLDPVQAAAQTITGVEDFLSVLCRVLPGSQPCFFTLSSNIKRWTLTEAITDTRATILARIAFTLAFETEENVNVST